MNRYRIAFKSADTQTEERPEYRRSGGKTVVVGMCAREYHEAVEFDVAAGSVEQAIKAARIVLRGKSTKSAKGSFDIESVERCGTIEVA